MEPAIIRNFGNWELQYRKIGNQASGPSTNGIQERGIQELMGTEIQGTRN
jgi:hypothetical protein